MVVVIVVVVVNTGLVFFELTFFLGKWRLEECLIIVVVVVVVAVVVIMEICKAPTPQLKALNKHNTHSVHRYGKCRQQFNQN